ncbi:MAG: hypothetical protein E7231_14190 [Cellulosilyticum sp.]|nr:hypothetical protein [Cellulosilyticum sp.]
MNTTELLKNTNRAFENAPELQSFTKHIQELESSILKLEAEVQLLLPKQAEFPETLGIISSVLENVRLEIKQMKHKHKEIQMKILTEQFVAPLMDELHKTLPYPTRVQINTSESDIEIQIELMNPEGVQTLTLVPDFAENRVLFVANPELCNLSPFGSLTNSFGHELLVAPSDMSTLIRLLNLK